MCLSLFSPLECDSVDLCASSHAAAFPSENYARLMKLLPALQARFPNMTISDEMLTKSVLEVSVYYEHPSYQLVEQYASLSLIDLIASLGGTLGLFLGVSFLSFIELLEVSIEIAIILVGSFKKHLKDHLRSPLVK